MGFGAGLRLSRPSQPLNQNPKPSHPKPLLPEGSLQMHLAEVSDAHAMTFHHGRVRGLAKFSVSAFVLKGLRFRVEGFLERLGFRAEGSGDPNSKKHLILCVCVCACAP